MSTGATTAWNIPLFGDNDFVTPIQTPLNAQANALDTALTNAINKAGFRGPYPDLATLNLPANVGTAVGQHATVNADATAVNNGDYIWTGSAWVLQGAWISLGTPANSFTVGTSQPSYRIVNGMVQLRGELFRATAPTSRLTALTLPAGVRPSSPILLPMGSPGWSSSLLIGTDGTMGIDGTIARTGSPGWTFGQIQFVL
jgi:hypothetical protein